MKRYLVLGLALCLLALAGASARGQDDDYVQIYSLIQEGDGLSASGSFDKALTKYHQAQVALERLHRAYPEWNPRIVNFRLGYLADQITGLTAKVRPAAPATAAVSNRPPVKATGAVPKGVAAAPGPAVSELHQQVASLKSQVHYLQGDKDLLQAKLKEALSAQPAAVDPREVARAQARVRQLEKENDLLKVTLAQAKAAKGSPPVPAAAPTPAPDNKALAQAQAALTEANRKLAEQTQRADRLAEEKKFLESKLIQLSPSPENGPALESTRKELAEATRQLAEQKALAAKLDSEKAALQARLDAAGGQSDALAALRAENALLKKQAAEARAAAEAASSKRSAGRDLAEARAQLAALQSERDVLRVEKDALANRLKEVMAWVGPGSFRMVTNTVVLTNTVVRSRTVVVTNTVVVPAANPETPQRLQALESERDALQAKLDAATREFNSRNNPASTGRVAELETQVAVLQRRVEVYETRRVPFSAEELAQLQKPAPRPAPPKAAAPTPAVPTPASAPAPSPSPQMLSLAREAQGYFAKHQYDKAEAAYVQVLRQDQTNVVALANLATIQLENNQLGAAQTNILQALRLAPKDAYGLSILGYLRYRQRQYDAALDALGQAAKLDPHNAQVQNYLGITLAEKGLRGPAEAAFRKAVELEPNYGDAHVNLAVIYLSQQPPAVELARWHYQRALSAGHAHEPYLDRQLEVGE